MKGYENIHKVVLTARKDRKNCYTDLTYGQKPRFIGRREARVIVRKIRKNEPLNTGNNYAFLSFLFCTTCEKNVWMEISKVYIILVNCTALHTAAYLTFVLSILQYLLRGSKKVLLNMTNILLPFCFLTAVFISRSTDSERLPLYPLAPWIRK